MSPDKTIGLSTVLSFAGIEMDTVRYEPRVTRYCAVVTAIKLFKTQEGHPSGITVSHRVGEFCLFSGSSWAHISASSYPLDYRDNTSTTFY